MNKSILIKNKSSLFSFRMEPLNFSGQTPRNEESLKISSVNNLVGGAEYKLNPLNKKNRSFATI